MNAAFWQDRNYGIEKFLELHSRLFCSLASARQRLTDCEDLFTVILPSTFVNPENQKVWEFCRAAVLSHIRNFGSERRPRHRLTIRNSTMERVLLGISEIHADLCRFDWSRS